MRDHDEIDRLLRESAVAAGVMVIALVAVVASCTSPDSGIGLAATPTSAASKTTAVASQLPSKPPPGTSPPSSTPTAATSALSPSSTVSPAPTLERPSVVNDDDPVVAYGNLFETRIADETLLCPAGGSPPDSTGCHGTVVVTVRGIDPRELPGLETNPTVPDLPGGTWVTQWVRVDGVWADGAFQATRVELAERPSFLELIQMPEVPCDSPTSGVPGYTGEPGDTERAREAFEVLEAEVARDPDTYSGISSAVIRGPDGGGFRPAIVVGTVLEVESVAQRLHAIYPYKPCILRVNHSARELQQSAEGVRALKRPWDVYEHEYGFGRVIVRVPVMDQQTDATLAPFGSIVSIRPFVAVTED